MGAKRLGAVALLLVCSFFAGRESYGQGTRTARADAGRQLERLGELEALLRQQTEKVNEISATLSRVEGEVGQALKRSNELEAELRPLREQLHGIQETLREMREEVRGLYVESSGLKGDIAQVADKLDGLSDDLSTFRLSAGILAALIVLLQILAIGLVIRARG